MMRLEQIDHVALRCASPEASKAWYVSTLGFEDVSSSHGAGSPILLRQGSTMLALFPQKIDAKASTNDRLWHVAFRAAAYADFQSAQTELQARSIPFKFQDHENSHSIYFSDPDGILLEITTYDVSKAEKNPA